MAQGEKAREYTMLNGQKIYPSALFSHDMRYLQFLDNILRQTEQASNNDRMSFFIGAKDMIPKKVFHDFLLETKRRFILSCSKD